MTEPTSLTALLRGRRIAGDHVTFTITPDWAQGRTTFGGLISMLAAQAMRDVAGSQWSADVKLRALQVNFIGPVAIGEMSVQVQTLREGKNVRQVLARVQHDGQIAALLIGVFGIDRTTALPTIEPEQPAAKHSPDTAKAPPPLPAGMAPNFLMHLDSRWGDGALPFSGQSRPESVIHTRLQGEPADADISDELLTVLLADVPPTPLLSHFNERVPASSVSWELELRPLATRSEAGGWWRIDTGTLAAKDGYVNQISKLWAPNGQLAALGYQVVMVFG